MNVRLALRLSLCVCVLLSPTVQAGESNHHSARGATVTVVGSASVAGVPDTITFQTGVTTSDVSAATALSQNTRVSASIRDVLTRHGVEEKQVQTARFDVNPVYDRATGNEQPRLAGYRVTHVLSVKFSDIDGAGALLDALIKTGSNVLQGVQFSVAEPAPLLTQARTLAVKDAVKKATTLAAAADRRLGSIRGIVEGGGGHQPLAGGAMEMRAMAAVPIAAGEQTFSVNVTVVFELDD